MNFKKIFTLTLITLLLINTTSSVLADSTHLTRNEIDKLITIDESEPLNTSELHKLIEAVDQFKATKNQEPSDKGLSKFFKIFQ